MITDEQGAAVSSTDVPYWHIKHALEILAGQELFIADHNQAIVDVCTAVLTREDLRDRFIALINGGGTASELSYRIRARKALVEVTHILFFHRHAVNAGGQSNASLST